ncbi:uncharacterized protein LOC108477479 [Gossypium arboreum]|uniref:uncharacterized protein LOC108477479 n=1 Tax=Gossypium arboreum TaxID=29729 RepID=UPI0008195692|nr:uncharacterized protein LOC108477479 [Gossypium arboreum]
MHPGSNKLYQDLRELYWWPGLKREVTEYVSKCLTCQQVKAKHQLPLGLLQPVKIQLWKWERRFRTPTCWTELGKRQVLGPKLISDIEDKVKLIRDRLKEASDRQKSYADLKCKKIEYSVGDYVFLKVSYQLEWPPKLDRIHDVFHVSILRQYRSDALHIVSVEEIEVGPDLTIKEELMQILDRDVKVLRKKSGPLVKVLRRNHDLEEAAWELEEAMQQQYPYLF